MDKHTLSHYGLILVSTIIIVIILGLLSPLTPFGDDVRASINEAVNKYIDKTPIEEVDNTRDNIEPTSDGKQIYKTVTISFLYESGGNVRTPLSYQVKYGDKFDVEEKIKTENIKVDGYETSNIPKSQSITKDTDFTIIFVPNSYTIKFETNGGKILSNTPYSYKFKQNIKLPTKVEKKGYYFVGWYETSDFSDNIHTEIQSYEKGNKTYYAKWTQKTYSITYISNGKVLTNIPSDKTKMIYGNSFELPLLKMENGLTFKGWYDNKHCQGNPIHNSPEFPANDITYYASWSENGYDITYKTNGGKFIGGYPQNYTTGIELTLPQNIEKKGYDFIGWFSDEVLTKEVKTIKSDEYGNKTYYAKWKNSTFKIVYDFDGGSTTQSYPTQYTYSKTKDSALYPTVVTKAGYRFLGWKDMTLGTFETNVIAGRIGNIKLVAQYEKITYTITYNGNGTNAYPLIQYSYIQYGGTYGSGPSINRNGYNFIGWFTESAGGKEVKSTDRYTLTSNQTLYAHWNIATYKITYMTDGGVFSSTPVNSYKFNSITTLPTNISKEHYIFSGWYTSSNFNENTKITKISKDTYNDIVLYAKWSPVSFNITYDTDGGSISGTYPTSYYYGIETRLPTPKKAGYIFTGWQNINDDNETLLFVPNNYSKDLSLKALYRVQDCTLTIFPVDENGNYFKDKTGKNISLNYPIILYDNEYTFSDSELVKILNLGENYYHLPFSVKFSSKEASSTQSDDFISGVTGTYQPFNKIIKLPVYKYIVIDCITYYDNVSYNVAGKENVYDKIYVKQLKHNNDPTIKIHQTILDETYQFDKCTDINATYEGDFVSQNYPLSVDKSLKSFISSGKTSLKIYYKSTKINISYDFGNGVTIANKSLINFAPSSFTSTEQSMTIKHTSLGNSTYKVVLNGFTNIDAVMPYLYSYNNVKNGEIYEININYVSGSMPSSASAMFAFDVKDINSSEQIGDSGRIYKDVQLPRSVNNSSDAASSTIKVYGLTQGQSNSRIQVCFYFGKATTFDNYTFTYTVKKVDTGNMKVNVNSYPSSIGYNGGNCAFTIKNPTRNCYIFKGFVEKDSNATTSDYINITDNGNGTTTITPLLPGDIELLALWEKDSDVEGNNHCLTNERIKIAGNCITNGIKTRTCAWCNVSKEYTTPATGHTPTKGNSSDVCSYCSVCNTVLSSNHSMRSYTVTSATCTSGGKDHYYCTQCNYAYDSNTSALGHNWTSSGTTTQTCDTGSYNYHTCGRCGYSEITGWNNGALGHLTNGSRGRCSTWHPKGYVTDPNWTGNKSSHKSCTSAFHVCCGRYVNGGYCSQAFWLSDKNRWDLWCSCAPRNANRPYLVDGQPTVFGCRWNFPGQ